MQHPKHAPQIGVERINPDKAAQLLGTMPGNRSLRAKMVARYAREMVAGKWLLNGESIKISREGRLIDGQHRLNAIIASKMTIEMFVVRGVDASAFVTLDTGISRTYHDTGVIAGRDWIKETGTIARWWLRYDRGVTTNAAYVTASHQELDAVIEAHPQIPESARAIKRLKVVQNRCLGGVQGFVHAYAAEKYDREMADSFMQDLNDGAQLPVTSPIYCLRSRLIDNREHRHQPEVVLALTIKAWNFWIKGDKVQVLRWTRAVNGPNGEDFPRFSIDLPAAGPKARTDRRAGTMRNERALARESTSVSESVSSR